MELAKLRGLRTVAAAAPTDEELVGRLGADEFVARYADGWCCSRTPVTH